MYCIISIFAGRGLLHTCMHANIYPYSPFTFAFLSLQALLLVLLVHLKLVALIWPDVGIQRLKLNTNKECIMCFDPHRCWWGVVLVTWYWWA